MEGTKIPLFIIMENSDICKFRRSIEEGISYKNGLVSGILTNSDDNRTIIFLAVFKITNIWELAEPDKPPQMENTMYSIGKLIYKDNECETIIYNEYPKEFLEEIIEGLKKMNTISCDDCIHKHKRNLLLGHNCSENFIKNKCKENEQYTEGKE